MSNLYKVKKKIEDVILTNELEQGKSQSSHRKGLPQTYRHFFSIPGLNNRYEDEVWMLGGSTNSTIFFRNC